MHNKKWKHQLCYKRTTGRHFIQMRKPSLPNGVNYKINFNEGIDLHWEVHIKCKRQFKKKHKTIVEIIKKSMYLLKILKLY